MASSSSNPLLYAGGECPPEWHARQFPDGLAAHNAWKGRLDGASTVDASQATKTEQGFLRVHVTVAQAGVVETVGPDGKKRRELRTENELGAADTLASLDTAPVVLGHPEGGITEQNAGTVIVGHVVAGTARVARNSVNEPGLTCDIIITAPDAVSVVEAKNLEAVIGYSSKRVDAAQNSITGSPHDAVQTDIRIAYVALVKPGTGDERIRLDGGDELVESDDPEAVRRARLARDANAWRDPNGEHRADGHDHFREPDGERERAARIARDAERWRERPALDGVDAPAGEHRADGAEELDAEAIRKTQLEKAANRWRGNK